jgi:hypothetical protein
MASFAIVSKTFSPAKRHVHFQDGGNKTKIAFTAFLICFFQPGSRIIANWKWIVALTATVDFFMLPLSVTVQRVWVAKGSLEVNPHIGSHKNNNGFFKYAALCLDVIFILDLLVMAARAVVWDLGFQNSTVEKLVDVAVEAISEAEEAQTATPKALGVRALASAAQFIGPQAHRHFFYICPRKLLLMAPLWLVYLLDLSGWALPVATLLRIYRLFDLMGYLSECQEDLASPIRWVAFFKFFFIIFASGHWTGCMFFFIAAASNFSLHHYLDNWVDDWCNQSHISYNWRISSNGYTYLVRSKPNLTVVRKQEENGCSLWG